MSQGSIEAPLINFQSFDDEEGTETIISVDHVSMVFNIASEQLNNLKEYVLAIAKHELHFKEFRALNDICFEVQKGDVFGILGTNGSGKSTMLKIIAGVLSPSEGTCTVKGSIAPLIELGAGFDMDLTARENVYLNGALLGYPKSFIQQHFDEIIAFAEVEDFLDMPLKNYSSGMVARIAFAIATVIVPDILIVDEVLSVGDYMFQQKCEQRITSLIKDHGVTVLIVSHNNDQIERLCNKAIWIEKGQTRMFGKAADVCATYSILGGRSGNAESEKTVLNVLNDLIPSTEETICNIAGDNRYDTTIELMDHCNFSNTADLIIAPGDYPPEVFIATSISGLLDAPLLTVKKDGVPGGVRQAIRQIRPQRVILVGGEDKISIKVKLEIESLCETDTSIVWLNETNQEILSCKAYEWSKVECTAGDTVIVAPLSSLGETLSLMPYCFTKQASILLCSSINNPGTHIKSILENSRPIRIILVNGDHSSSSVFRSLSVNTDIVSFPIIETYHTNKIIADWFCKQRKLEGQTIRHLTVCSIWDAADALATGVYCGKNNSMLLFEDKKDLNSVAAAINYIYSHNGEIDSLTFIGNDLHFQTIDKRLLATALFQAKSSSCKLS